MNKDMITIYDQGEKREYRLLMVIDKEYKYIIYTDKENKEIDKNLFVAKVKSIDNVNETLPITDEEWEMIEKEYQKILKIKAS